jgi:hypothetical protein
VLLLHGFEALPAAPGSKRSQSLSVPTPISDPAIRGGVVRVLARFCVPTKQDSATTDSPAELPLGTSR